MASVASSTAAKLSASSTSVAGGQTSSSPTMPSSSSSLPSMTFPPPQQHQRQQPAAPPSAVASASAPSSKPGASDADAAGSSNTPQPLPSSQPQASSSAASLPQPPAPPRTTSTTAGSHISPHLPTPSSEREVGEARAAVVASLGNLLDSELQSRAQILHSNAAALEKQEKQLLRATDGLRRENDKLGRVAEDAARKVKLLGNVQNWAEVLERDFLVLEETVRLANGGGSGDGCGSSCCSCSDAGDGASSWSGSEDGGGGDGGGGDRRDAVEVDDMYGDPCSKRNDLDDDIHRDKRMAGGLDFMGRKFDDGNGDGDKLDKLDKGKGTAIEGDVVDHGVDMMDADGYGSHTAFSDTSRSLAEAESMNGTDGRTKESETTSLSTTGGGG